MSPQIKRPVHLHLHLHLLLLGLLMCRLYADEGEGSAIITPFKCGSDLAMDFAEVRYNVKRFPDDTTDFDFSDIDVHLMATNDNCFDCTSSYVSGNVSSLGRGNNCAALLTSYS